ncbi:large subunit ribosomal protein MRP49, partial [Lecanoromycetidae sp. Uapishka_2]
MANVAKRMKKLRALLDIRLGPGAAILSDNVKRIHLEFATKINDGHAGARKVWRNSLPRLKYHNPAISMTINRTQDQEGPATLSIQFAAPSDSPSSTDSPAPSSSTSPSAALSGHSPSRRTETIDMKHKHESEILSKLLELTKATPYEATPDEVAELREEEDFTRRSERDRAAQAKLNETRRQERALLEAARGGAMETV